MGTDEGILLTDEAFAGADTWATSTTLGKAIETVGHFDLILCGRQAIDGDTAQIGPQVADYLGIPQVTYIFEIEEIKKKSIIVKRRLEDGFERVECSLPALLTVIREFNIPRYARVDRLIDTCHEDAPIKIWNAADIGVQTQDVGLEGSLTHVIKTFAPKLQRCGEIIEGNARTSAKHLINKLRVNRLVP
jgi:electron transfer flavoprotein beta subunit